MTAPVALFRATMDAPGPPGVTITRSPSTRGDSLYPHRGSRPLKSATKLVPQTRLPSTVGVPRGPLPLSLLKARPLGVFQSCLPVAASRARTNSRSPNCPWVYRRLPTTCLLYTSDAADDLLCVDLGG